MNTFRSLSDEQLIEAYKQGMALSMDRDFIILLKQELQRRNIKPNKYMHFQ